MLLLGIKINYRIYRVCRRYNFAVQSFTQLHKRYYLKL